MKLIDGFINVLEEVFSEKEYSFRIEIADRGRLLKQFSSIKKFKDYLWQHFRSKLPHPETEQLFRYANFGIAILNPKKELYLIHDGYINGYTHICKYHYYRNSKKSSNRLRGISKGIKHIDEESIYIFYHDILKCNDYRLKTILLNLYIETYINKIIEKRFGNIVTEIMWRFYDKIQLLKKKKIISADLYSTCEEINHIRNKISHNLFHLVWEDMLTIKKIKLKRYELNYNPKNINRKNINQIITSISMEVLDELAEIYEKL